MALTAWPKLPARNVAVHGGSTEELRMIDQIERFDAKFESAIVSHKEAARERCVQIFHAGTREEPATRVSHCSQCGKSELRSIEHGCAARIRLYRNGRALHSGVSTPLLLMPFGIVPSSDVSLLLSNVTGNPDVMRAIPATDQPDAIARSGDLDVTYWQVVVKAADQILPHIERMRALG